jgi:hypothetical protein
VEHDEIQQDMIVDQLDLWELSHRLQDAGVDAGPKRQFSDDPWVKDDPQVSKQAHQGFVAGSEVM